MDINPTFKHCTRLVFGSTDHTASIDLRSRILRIPLGLEYSEADLASEHDQWHLAYIEEGKVIGILLMKDVGGGMMKMRQVAIEEVWQGRGIGSMLVKYAEYLADRAGMHTIELHARDVAVPFYLKLHYSIVGEPFEEVGIKHYKMLKNL